MLEFLKKITLKKILTTLRKNEIGVTICEAKTEESALKSKFGGKPAVPSDFIWPRFESADYNGEIANRPLSFLCQINLAEIQAYDREKLLPQKGMLLFFYEQETMCWGYDPTEKGCARVYYFEDVNELSALDFPEDLREDYRLKAYGLSFEAKDSYPSFEELDCHVETDCDFEVYDETLEKMGYDIEFERHKLLGYADPVQSEMLTECERVTRGLYCGDAESYRNTPEDEEASIQKAAADWTLLFQMASIEEDGCELMFGDVGNLYFYIRKQDLKARNFDKIWLILQCG